MSNIARDVIWPTDPKIVLRAVLLHVGQGSSTVVLAKEGATYKTLLVDINQDEKGEGIDVPKLMTDLLDGGDLDVFINSHPHNDHLCGIKQLADAVTIREVWHSNHKPGKEDQGAYDDLQNVIKKVTKAYGAETETHLFGSNTSQALGEAECHILAPAKHICEEIGNEKEEDRRKRIHEQCAVLKFGIADTWIMLPGDADRDAWELNIYKYHKDRIGAQVLAGIHHGSRSFFKKSEEDEDIYLDALQGIDPDYVIVSAPKQENSRHEHPHDDAMEIYTDHVGADNLLHTGENLYSYIVDIYEDGKYSVTDDSGELTEAYPYKAGSGGTEDGSKRTSGFPAVVISPATRIDRRPMGND